MRSHKFIALAVAAMAVGCLVGRPSVCLAAESGGKIALRVLYVGNPGSDRAKDFVGLLEKHFAKVGTGDLQAFKEEQTRDFDVVVLDTGDLARNAPRPQLSTDYARPTITIGVAGAQLCSGLKLKTGYA